MSKNRIQRWYRNVLTQNESTSTFLIAVITAILSLPVFILVYAYVPEISLPFGEGTRVDHVITFVFVFATVYLLVKKLRLIVYGLAIIGLLVLTYTNFSGTYGLKDLYQKLQINHNHNFLLMI